MNGYTLDLSNQAPASIRVRDVMTGQRESELLNNEVDYDHTAEVLGRQLPSPLLPPSRRLSFIQIHNT